ncbi:hypothetical protein [Fibrella aquatica]|uniref:hypothetical protein n=1 Tax=Fibrella aquatica TaxID=3242487 RepID=UPI003522A8AB
MKRLLIGLVLALVSTLAQAQFSQDSQGNPIYRPRDNKPTVTLATTAEVNRLISLIPTPVTAFSALTGIPSYLTSTALGAKLETALYTTNRLNDRAEVDSKIATALGGKLSLTETTTTAETTAAATGPAKLIIQTISGTTTVYIYSPTASPTLLKILTYN